MNHYIQLKKSNCRNCYKCIRHCPVKSIRFADHQAHIVKEQCILCGECFISCPQNAKQIRNDVASVKEMLLSGRPVYASVAPSFAANYEGADIGSMEAALKKLGFTAAEETALGATTVKNRYNEIISRGELSVIISSCCHTVNMLVQKYYPEALPYLAKVVSPMQAHCSRLKEEHPEALTVFIGPCISKKEEADLYPGSVDCVLTFEELTEWLKEASISIPPAAGDEGSERGRARLFPVAGGIIRSMMPKRMDYDYITVDGIANCIQAIHNVINGKLKNCFIEMSACAGSCIGGPAMDRGERMPITDYIRISRCAGEKDFEVPVPASCHLEKQFPYLGVNFMMPGSTAIREILKKMGKTSSEQELNCGSCGYNTCREKAIAVFQGKADLTMCLPFLKEKAENFSDNIIYNMPNGVIVLNEELEIQQINRAAKQIFGLQDAGAVLNSPVIRLLNPASYLEVIESGQNIRDRLTFLEGCGKYVEETVIHDKTYHILISIIKDVTMEVNTRLKKEQVNKQSVEIADKVIEKQLRIVQEIASLLGETAAETKIALTNLKETLQNE
jgi:iron only hydrogenase large subunit-like protein/uncharacterized Fe-S cluster-containing protein